MNKKKNIFAIIGSARANSSNLALAQIMEKMTENEFNWTIFADLKKLPHFDPELSLENTPQQIIEFRSAIEKADGVIISTPEYIFSIPSGLKNALEWCVSTMILSEKPIGLVTASASGHKGHEELQFILKTVMARFTKDTTLLIQGIKGKLDDQGQLTDNIVENEVNEFVFAFTQLVKNG